MTPLVEALRRHRARQADLDTTRELVNAAIGRRARAVARRTGHRSRAEVAALEDQIRTLMLPKDPNDGRAVIMEIRGAEGGEEANLFARDLFEMYQAYAGREGWKVEVLSSDPSDLGGLNQVTFVVRGDTAWSHLKFEGGTASRAARAGDREPGPHPHVVGDGAGRCPRPTRSRSRSTSATCEIDVYRSSGAGGQSVNTTDSAVRITHRPTGIVVTMQDERSQLQNRARAMKVLRARLLQLAQEEHDAAMSVERRAQVGGGGRGEKIRTYNYKENRRHRPPHRVHHLPARRTCWPATSTTSSTR